MNYKRRQFLGTSLKAAMVLPLIGRSGYSFAAPEADEAKRAATIRDLAIANHILYRHGVLDAYGHISARDPLNPKQYLMSRFMPPALVTAADILTLDADSKPVGGDTRNASSERFIHGEIYRVRPDVNAVVHCHTPALIPFGDTDVPLKAVYHMGYFMTDGIPIYEIRNYRPATSKTMLVETQELGAALAKVLGSHNVALMRGHGAVVVGSDIPTVVGRAFYLKENAEAEEKALALSQKINYLEPGENAVQPHLQEWQLWVNEDAHGGCPSPAK